MKSAYVYILASKSRVLYVGVTTNLVRRIFEHRSGIHDGFTTKYRVNHLVHFETTSHIRAAIAREKEIKGWRREKKLKLIESTNAGWIDLAGGWFDSLDVTTPASSRGSNATEGPAHPTR